MNKATLNVYHGTTSERAMSIINSEFMPSVDKKCKLYLGKGIYFYIEYKDAISWIIKKYRENHNILPSKTNLNCEYKIIKSELLVNEESILDLDKIENLKIFNEFVDKIKGKLQTKEEYIYAKNKNGAIINYLVKVKYLEGTDIIIRSIRDKIERPIFHLFNDIFRKVVCVKNNKIIKSKTITQEISEADFDTVKYFFD